MTDFQEAQENINTIFDIFAHHRRRYALRGLRMHENPLALADLADEVAIRENEAPITEISAEEVKSVYMSLYHTHIPKLVSENFVRYDQAQDAVILLERAETISAHQELLTVDRDISAR